MPWRVLILWLLFLARGCFYCTMLPLWEGWDEYAHFAWLQHWVDEGTLPVFHDPVSREIDESMRLTPLAHELSWIGPPYLTHEQWWALPEATRAERVRQLKALPPAFAHQTARHTFDFYEAQQPPLYYLAVAVPLRWMESWPLRRRVLAIRFLSMAIASFAIPLTWMAARLVVNDGLAVLCAALLAVAPGFAIDVSRVANDCAAVVFAGALFWLLIRGRSSGWSVGLVLGAALLSKAYLLALIPGIVFIWRRRKRELAIALGIAAVAAGWWYARNLLLGNAFSGWALQANTGAVLSGVFRINWLSAAHVIAKSFIWFGAWSFLTLKSWMYLVVETGTLAAFARAAKTRDIKLAAPAVLCGFYVFAMGYGVAVYWATQHVPNLPGWYLWPVASMLVVIVVAGLQRFTVWMIAGLAAIDLYGVTALLTPYYAGLVERNRAAGGQFLNALARLELPVWMAVAWALATIAIVIIVLMTNYGGTRLKGDRQSGD